MCKYLTTTVPVVVVYECLEKLLWFSLVEDFEFSYYCWQRAILLPSFDVCLVWSARNDAFPMCTCTITRTSWTEHSNYVIHSHILYSCHCLDVIATNSM